MYVDPGSVGEAQLGSMCVKLSDIPVCVDKVQRFNLGLYSCAGVACIDKVISTVQILTRIPSILYVLIMVESPMKCQMASHLRLLYVLMNCVWARILVCMGILLLARVHNKKY